MSIASIVLSGCGIVVRRDEVRAVVWGDEARAGSRDEEDEAGHGAGEILLVSFAAA